MVDSTSESLLVRLQASGSDEAWARFSDLYTPLIFYWARRNGLDSHDAADLVQEVMALVFQKLPEFQYDAQLLQAEIKVFRLVGNPKKVLRLIKLLPQVDGQFRMRTAINKRENSLIVSGTKKQLDQVEKMIAEYERSKPAEGSEAK